MRSPAAPIAALCPAPVSASSPRANLAGGRASSAGRSTRGDSAAIANSLARNGARGGSINHHAPDRLALVHQVEAVIDLVERHGVGDQVVDIDLAVHVPIDDARHVGAAARPAKGGALPDAPGDELERPRRNLLAGAGDADDDADPPAAMTAFKRLTHRRDIADALEAVIGAALGEVDEIGHEVALDLLRVDEMRHAEFFGERAPRRVDVDTDDHLGADHPRALHDVEPDPAEPEHDDLGAGLDLRGVDDRADPRRDAAADVADLVEGGVLADFGDRDLGQHGEVRKGRGAHVMMDLLPAQGEPASAVWHHPLALGRTDRRAEIGRARQAALA